jgi:hypothetical protein
MRFKITLTLVAILIILGITAYLFERGEVREQQGASPKAVIFPVFKTEQAANIEIKTKGKTVSLTKKEGRWLVALDGDYYPADKNEVDNIFRTVNKMQRENVVSTDPAKYPVFELDQENGVEVKVSKADNSVLAHFFVGKNGPDLISTYIRIEGEKEVLLLSGMLNATFGKTLKDWRDKAIFNLKAEDIVRVNIASPKNKTSLKKDEEGNWEMVVPEKAKVKKDVIEGMVNTLATLNAYDFEDGADLKACGLTSPPTKIQITMKDNSTLSLLIGNEKDSSKRYVKREDNPTVFLVQNFDLGPILQEPAELKEGN